MHLLAATLLGLAVLPPLAATAAPLGLPPLSQPRDNPPTAAKIALGRMLFMDRRLSHNNTLSCAMCHVPEQGFTSNELATAIGVEGSSLRRNTPSLYNVGHVEQLFHDGREFSLENQAWGPLLAAAEMANPSIGYVVEKVRRLPEYRGRFTRAFGRGPDADAIGKALAAYQRTLVSGNSRFDRWHYGRRGDALDADEQAGFRLFTGKAGCVACHRIGRHHALFTDHDFHNTGIGYARSMATGERRRVRLAPGLETEVGAAELAAFAAPLPDTGRYEVTLDPDDTWKYRTPGLRNVALTAPYMHDGSLSTLAAVIDFYDAGGIDNPQRDARLRPLGLTAAEKRQLEAFLGTLTGDNVSRLAAAARAAQMPDDVPEPDPASLQRRRR